MHKIEIIENNTVLTFPESAHEFTQEQVIAFSKLAWQYQSGVIDFNTLKTRMVYKFLNMKRTADLSKEENAQVVENIYVISKLIDNFFSEERIEAKTVKQIKMDFYIQKIPKIEVNNVFYHGPTDALFNTVFGEYIQLNSLLVDFSTTPQEETLNNLIATIYRPQKPNYHTVKNTPDFDGDIRIKFNPNLTQNYAKNIAHLPYHIKYAIFLYIASSQHFICTNSSLLIGGGNSIDLSILFQKSTTQSKNSLGLIGTLYSLAETKVFGNVDEVAQKNTYDVLAFLVNQTEQANKLKSNSNATTT